ncbi:hypothetical protein [Capnocytophaga stomatis]|uniref:hypothetical protein n=1 Tax=Capnocytophaga stomatis TaxID=1848904 RepID=UPI001ACDF419|nr:hypothetical protein [Capnocytophaga stomatis]GIM48571.1 hypothetical protein CAPN003_00230 [Capnocytophaga stomatis]
MVGEGVAREQQSKPIPDEAVVRKFQLQPAEEYRVDCKQQLQPTVGGGVAQEK